MVRRDVCSVSAVDEQKVTAVRNRLPGKEEITEIAQTFQVLGDPGRVQIVMALAAEELCVCDLASLLGTSVSAVSHQLRVLRERKVVKFRREGKKVFYTLDDHHMETLIRQAQEHISE